MIDRDKEFFIIRSDALDAVRTRLYGYSVSPAGIVTNDCLAAGGGSSSQLTPEGAWVFVERAGDTIVVRQDFVGCYGLYLFRDGDFWALSNCYNYLVDCLKSTHHLTLNRDYADHLLASGLAALACEETLVNEVTCLDRAAVVTIDCAMRRLSTEFIDYRESTLDLDTPEGMAVLDEWFFRWTGIIRNLAARNGDIQTDLSGGFDSRLTLALFLGSGVDLGGVCVNSSQDGLHTHKEDYEIAESIAGSYGFRLNDRSCFTGKSINVSLKDALDASLELKLGFHSQMYWKCSRYDAPLFWFTGQGGGCLRNLAESLKGWDFEQNLVSHTSGRAKRYGKEIKDSWDRVIARSLAVVHGKHERAGRELDPAKVGIAFYLETRNRNHFGRDQVESFCGANVFKLCPLLDSGLRRLKNNTGECDDQNLLIAVLLDRYGKGLLDFEVEGGRTVADETKDCARRLNARFPFDAGGAAKVGREAFVMPPAEVVAQCDGPAASGNDARATVRDAFLSWEVKELFEQLYSTELYYQLAQRFERVRFYPESDAYAVLAVCKARRDCDLGASKENLETAAEFVSRCAQETRREGYPHDYLRWSLAVTRSITARIDLQNKGERDCSLECVAEEGLRTNVSAPSWLAGGRGRIVESDLGSLDMRLRCLGKGELRIALRGEDVRDAQGNHVPVWIDYTSVLINGKEQLQDVTCAWCDKPHRLAFPVSDGEELDVRVCWRPHDESARNLGLEARQAAEATLAAARKEAQRALDDLAAAQDEAREAKAQLAERAVEFAKAKEDIEGLQLAVAEAQRARDAEAARFDGLAAEVERLESLVAEARRARDAEATRADDLAAEVARLRGSASWKAGRVVTWPARKLKRLVKRLAASGTSAN